MAKMFYSLEEAAGKLKKSPDEVKKLVEQGQLQEFRDRDRLMFKVEQVDLLAGTSEDDGETIPLADSATGGSSISLVSDSGTGMNLESPKEQTGISIFEAEATEEADPSAVTQVTEQAPTELSLETVGSGSGLMELTREADDTSLGADLLQDIYSGEKGAAGEGATAEGAEGGALFESTGAESDAGSGAGSPALMAALAEPYDGAASGLAGGLAVGMLAALGMALTLAIAAVSGNSGFKLTDAVGQNFWIFVGALAGVTLIGGVLGMVLGKRT